MRLVRFITSGILAIGTIGATSAQDAPPSQYADQTGSFAGDYLCMATAAGGVKKDDETGLWKAVTFNVDNDRFVMRIDALGRLDRPSYTGSLESAVSYSVQIAESASGNKRNCTDTSENILWIGHKGYFSCRSIFSSYLFNLEDGRYQITTEIGYVDGSGDTPNITIGECVRF